MSTRWYPLYQKGGPQLRVFLPNFWMKLIRPTEEQPPNIVQFACSMEMTKYDIQNYLEKIYGVKCVDVRTRINMTKPRRDPGKGYLVKDEDVKYAYVTLPRNESFTFPDLFPKTEATTKEEYEKALTEAKKGFDTYLEKNKGRTNVPPWFTI